MPHYIIGTAGHIDHGKSALVQSLTGTHPDRLKEEQEREMTIDLGFAFWGDQITFIDVPGHEKFVKNMTAGVSTIDLVLLVIAADDGIMPQTLEHFEILQLLGVRQGIIVLTKIDLVEPDWLELVREEIRQLVRGSFLESAPIIPISNVTGQGLDYLKQQLQLTLPTIVARPDKGIFRLWIDRVFSMKGSGTVVAGTVLSGACKTGDTVELLPRQKLLRVRRVQVHNKSLEQCVTGERAAINLMDIDKADIQRGDILAWPNYFQPTYMFNARLQLLKSCARPLKNRARVHLHLGTGEIIARVVLLERNDLAPGQAAFVQFRLEAPVAPDYGDLFVIRSFSPTRTIGGGVVVEVQASKTKWLPVVELQRLALLEQASPRDMVEQYLLKQAYEPQSVSALSKALATPIAEIQATLELLLAEQRLVLITEKPGRTVLHQSAFRRAQELIQDYLTNFHQQNPMRWGIKKSEIKERLFGKVTQLFLDAVLKALQENGTIKIKEETVLLAEYIIRFTPAQEQIRRKMEALYLQREFVTPGWDEISQEITGNPKEIQAVLTGLIELGILVEIRYYEKPSIFHKQCLDRAQAILLNYFKNHEEIRLGEFREMINSTRKYATPILIYFDKLGLTERDGDLRRLNPSWH